MKFGLTVGVVAFAAAFTGGAYAADMAAPMAVGFDWTGFYAGVGITGGAFTTGPTPSNFASVDAIAGANITNDLLLFGVEGQVSWYHDFTFGSDWYAKGEVRAGYLATDTALLYLSGSGVHFSGGANYGGFGGGVEFAAMDNMTIDIEGNYYPWSNNAYRLATVSASVLWHFN